MSQQRNVKKPKKPNFILNSHSLMKLSILSTGQDLMNALNGFYGPQFIDHLLQLETLSRFWDDGTINYRLPPLAPAPAPQSASAPEPHEPEVTNARPMPFVIIGFI